MICPRRGFDFFELTTRARIFSVEAELAGGAAMTEAGAFLNGLSTTESDKMNALPSNHNIDTVVWEYVSAPRFTMPVFGLTLLAKSAGSDNSHLLPCRVPRETL